MTKICNVCKEKKPLVDFNKNKSRKDGLEYHCKECGVKKSKKYYMDNKEKKSAYCKNRKSENPILFKIQNNKYYARNKEAVLKKQKYEIDNMTDTYIKKTIRRYLGLSDVPPEFLEAKRNLLLIKRIMIN